MYLDRFYRKIFAERLKGLRENKGITQQDLADQLGIARNTISGYETGARIPDLERLYAIAKIFVVTTDYLVGMTNNKNFCA